MSLTTHAINAPIANVYAVATGDRDPLDYSGEASSPGVWLNDGDDATCLASDDPADLLALLDRARAAVVARFPHLAPAEPLTDDAALAAANEGARRAWCVKCERGHEGECTGPLPATEPCVSCGAPATDQTRDVNASGPWVFVCSDACADKALAHAADCDCTTCEEERAAEPAGPVCSECREPLTGDWRDAFGMCGSCVHNAVRSGWTPTA